MQIRSLGHVVLRVSDLARGERFYGELLGLPVCAHFDEQGMKMAFFTLGDHHDFAISEVGGDGTARSESSPGLDHVAFNIGTTLDELRAAREYLEAAGVVTNPVDHE
jgi:catechol 2,3-dioxygenase